MSIESEAEKGMSNALEHFKEELRNIRTGRANPGMLDSVTVEVYGSQMRIRDVANVTSPEARQLLVSPYDPSAAEQIAKGIANAGLGFMPVAEAGQVRINIPPMDESMRKQMVKLVKDLQEKCKISIRNYRRDGNDQAKKSKADGDITEDMQKGIEKKIQTLTDDFCKQADTIAQDKEKEVMTI